jgi:hypothetical protein
MKFCRKLESVFGVIKYVTYLWKANATNEPEEDVDIIGVSEIQFRGLVYTLDYRFALKSTSKLSQDNTVP